MKSVLLTGATGFLGRQLALRLADSSVKVHVLYRSKARLEGLEHENIIPFGGSLGDPQSISRAMEGCTQVYHMAAFASSWAKDSGIFFEQNVKGTENVLEAAMRLGIEKLVYTSTAGVLGPSAGEADTEDKIYRGPHLTHYDHSKATAEDLVMSYVSRGLPALMVNPSRIFGPGQLGPNNSAVLIDSYLKGKWRIIPGDGKSKGNYVYVEDVVDCHLLAMEKGRIGQRYISGGENLSYNEYFGIIREVSGINHRMIRIPIALMLAVSAGMQATAWTLSRFSPGRWTPPITPAFVRRYNHNWILSSEKAISELGYRPVDFRTGLIKTMKWLGYQTEMT